MAAVALHLFTTLQTLSRTESSYIHLPVFSPSPSPSHLIQMPPVTNNHSASGYGKSYSGSYSAGRYDHADSLSAADYNKSAYGNAPLSGSAGKLSCKSRICVCFDFHGVNYVFF